MHPGNQDQLIVCVGRVIDFDCFDDRLVQPQHHTPYALRWNHARRPPLYVPNLNNSEPREKAACGGFRGSIHPRICQESLDFRPLLREPLVGPPEAISITAPKGLDEPMSLVLILDDDSEVEIAVSSSDLKLATGPY